MTAGHPVKAGRAEASASALPVVFEDFYREHFRHLVVHLKRTAKLDLETAEEVVQDAFIALYGRWDQIEDIEFPRAYVFKIAKNRAVDYSRKRQRRELLFDSIVSHADLADDPISRVDEQAMLASLIGQLPERQRDVLVMSAMLGMSHSEIAEVLMLAPSTIAVHLSCARKNLRRRLSSLAGHPTDADI